LADEDGVTWEQALDFTLLEMRVGALPWHFEDAVMLRERERLAPSFRDHHELWPVVRNKVLRLARYQGAVAALVQEIVDGPETGPAFVTFESLQVGAWFVQLACPSEKPPSLLTGKHCPIPALRELQPSTVRRLRSLLQRTGSPSEWEELLG
jgi:hypothetical protein